VGEIALNLSVANP